MTPSLPIIHRPAPWALLAALVLSTWPSALTAQSSPEATLTIRCDDPDTRLFHPQIDDLSCDQPTSVPLGEVEIIAALEDAVLHYPLTIDEPGDVVVDLPLQTAPGPEPTQDEALADTADTEDPPSSAEATADDEEDVDDEEQASAPPAEPIYDASEPFELPSGTISWNTLRSSRQSGQDSRARSLLPNPDSYDDDDTSQPSSSDSSSSTAPVTERRSTSSPSEPPAGDKPALDEPSSPSTTPSYPSVSLISAVGTRAINLDGMMHDSIHYDREITFASLALGFWFRPRTRLAFETTLTRHSPTDSRFNELEGQSHNQLQTNLMIAPLLRSRVDLWAGAGVFIQSRPHEGLVAVDDSGNEQWLLDNTYSLLGLTFFKTRMDLFAGRTVSPFASLQVDYLSGAAPNRSATSATTYLGLSIGLN